MVWLNWWPKQKRIQFFQTIVCIRLLLFLFLILLNYFAPVWHWSIYSICVVAHCAHCIHYSRQYVCRTAADAASANQFSCFVLSCFSALLRFASVCKSRYRVTTKEIFSKTKTTKSLKGQRKEKSRSVPSSVLCRQTNGNNSEKDLHLSDIIYPQWLLFFFTTLCCIGSKVRNHYTRTDPWCSFLLLFTLQQIYFNIFIVSDAHSLHSFPSIFAGARSQSYRNWNQILFPIIVMRVRVFPSLCRFFLFLIPVVPFCVYTYRPLLCLLLFLPRSLHPSLLVDNSSLNFILSYSFARWKVCVCSVYRISKARMRHKIDQHIVHTQFQCPN